MKKLLEEKLDDWNEFKKFKDFLTTSFGEDIVKISVKKSIHNFDEIFFKTNKWTIKSKLMMEVVDKIIKEYEKEILEILRGE